MARSIRRMSFNNWLSGAAHSLVNSSSSGHVCIRHGSRDTKLTPRDTELTTRGTDLVDMATVHAEWKLAGYSSRAPINAARYGPKCVTTLLEHNQVTKHVFDGIVHNVFPLTASYGERTADLGGIISPRHALSPPQVSWDKRNTYTDKKYSLILVCPDCTSCNIHWFVKNISPSADTVQSIDTRDTNRSEVLGYVPPVPLKGTGFYRYVLVLLEQLQEGEISDPCDVSRAECLPDVMSRFSLAPRGVAMFQSCWDSTVGYSLAAHLQLDEKQYVVQRTKSVQEHEAEELFLRREWEMKTGFM